MAAALIAPAEVPVTTVNGRGVPAGSHSAIACRTPA
jgi:hypothetical protein